MQNPCVVVVVKDTIVVAANEKGVDHSDIIGLGLEEAVGILRKKSYVRETRDVGPLSKDAVQAWLRRGREPPFLWTNFLCYLFNL